MNYQILKEAKGVLVHQERDNNNLCNDYNEKLRYTQPSNWIRACGIEVFYSTMEQACIQFRLIIFKFKFHVEIYNLR